MKQESRREFYETHGLLTRQCLGYFLSDSAQCWPQHEMIVYRGRRYTYRDIWRWSMKTAHALTSHGVGLDDRVLVQAANSIELLVLQFAIWRIGAVCVPVLPIYRQHEVRTILADTRPSVLAANQEFRGRVLCAELDALCAELGVQPKVRFAVESNVERAMWSHLPPAPAADETIVEEALPDTASARACAVILYTSGTTAAPKGVMLSGESILSQARSLAKLYGISQSQDAVLCASPLAHTAALSYGILMPMMAGARTVLMPAWNAAEAIAIIDTERATIMSAPVLFLYDLVEGYEANRNVAHRLSVFNSGGGVNPPSLIRRADALGIKATRNYGMTESCGGCTLSSPNDPLEMRANFDGRPLYGSEVQVVDADRRPLPPGQVGELRVRTPQLMLGYTDPALTAQQVDSDGWFYSGDIGMVDAEGWLMVTGRLKDIINRGGEKFSAHDIEAALTSHPDVSEAAVVGAPDERFGEAVAAFLKLHPHVQWSGPAPLLAHLEGLQLARQKFPAHWYVVDEFPRTVTGKVQKQLLRDRLSSAAGNLP